MSTSPDKRDETPAQPDRSSVILLLGDIADTSWRMFVPTIGLTILGLLLDKQFGTSPLLLTVGIVLGIIAAGLLIRQQLKKVQ